jgi:multidrug efflux pump subunit AcrB
MAVVFAMLTSYFLSRTLVPTLVRYLLSGEPPEGATGRGPLARLHGSIQRGFERLQERYARALSLALDHRRAFVASFSVLVVASLALVPLLGRDFFPTVDAGQMQLHVRAPAGTRIEETEQLLADVEDHVRRIVPPAELDSVIQNIGIPVSGINLALGDPSLISSADADMLITLKPKHRSTADYVHLLRGDLNESFPGSTFFFLPADITSQVLSFGLPAPIDIRLTGPIRNQSQNLTIAQDLAKRIAGVPGAVDVHLAQVTSTPSLFVDVDRTLSEQVGLTQRDVASDMLVSLASSGQTALNFWLDPATGVQYLVAVQTPQWRIDSIHALQTTPLTPAATTGTPQLLANVAQVSRTETPTNVTHYNIARTLDVLLGVDGAPLGSVASGVQRIVQEAERRLPRGTSISVQGQAQSMNASFRGLELGIVLAVVLVYLLMVVNFQSWVEPAVILMALPGALAGIAWMLFVTGTTLSIPALMGTLMAIGVATANSILVVTFANERRREGVDARTAALAAGRTRLRPVIMTAVAMILGMLPMSLGLGDGGETNAPLGRAVIGGLLLATASTLFFVPVMYSLVSRKPPRVVTLETEQERPS